MVRLWCVGSLVRWRTTLTGNFLGGPSHLIHIDDIQITPDPPQKGQEMTVTVKGTAKDRIEVSVP